MCWCVKSYNVARPLVCSGWRAVARERWQIVTRDQENAKIFAIIDERSRARRALSRRVAILSLTGPHDDGNNGTYYQADTTTGHAYYYPATPGHRARITFARLMKD